MTQRMIHSDAPRWASFFLSSGGARRIDRRYRRPSVVLLLSALAALSACSSSAPEILRIDARLVVTDSVITGARSERIQIAVEVRDADGTGEISELEVAILDAGVAWFIPPERQIRTESDGALWISAPNLSLNGTVPAGRWHVAVRDLSGRVAEREVIAPVAPADASLRLEPARPPYTHLVVPAGMTAVYASGPDERRIDIPSAGRVRLAPATAELLSSGEWYLVGEVARDVLIESGPW